MIDPIELHDQNGPASRIHNNARQLFFNHSSAVIISKDLMISLYILGLK